MHNENDRPDSELRDMDEIHSNQIAIEERFILDLLSQEISSIQEAIGLFYDEESLVLYDKSIDILGEAGASLLIEA